MASQGCQNTSHVSVYGVWCACRPAVPPSSPVVFDVQLLYIPGLDDE